MTRLALEMLGYEVLAARGGEGIRVKESMGDLTGVGPALGSKSLASARSISARSSAS